jgi:hypothetical protein
MFSLGSRLLAGTLILLLLTIRTLAELAIFTLDLDLPALPAIEERLHMHPMCEPFVVQSIALDPASGTKACKLDEWTPPGTLTCRLAFISS